MNINGLINERVVEAHLLYNEHATPMSKKTPLCEVVQYGYIFMSAVLENPEIHIPC